MPKKRIAIDDDDESPTVKKFNCDHKDCYYGTDIKSNMKSHVKTHGDRDQLSCKVKSCSYTFVNKYVLERHMQSKHSSVMYKCTICSTEFNRKDKRAKHEMGCVNNSDKIKVLQTDCQRQINECLNSIEEIETKIAVIHNYPEPGDERGVADIINVLKV